MGVLMAWWTISIPGSSTGVDLDDFLVDISVAAAPTAAIKEVGEDARKRGAAVAYCDTAVYCCCSMGDGLLTDRYVVPGTINVLYRGPVSK
ncbi:hypothetical protein BJ741DRAFT_610545 [Chytriomyces cf. hyalinus JEL632]|nr:hypothetical protein BJ741DRAFT_610545 [Chytriomyces cf. hyalinus JEL632]